MDAEEAPKSAVVPDEATIAKATVEMLTGDAEVVAAYGAGTLTVRVLMTAVAGKLGVTDAAQAKAFVKPTVKATLMDYMAAHDPAPAEDAAPAAPPRKKPSGGGKRSGKITDQAALKAKMDDDGWTTIEKPRPEAQQTAKGGRHVDKYYRKPGESKQYRSLLDIARTHYPELVGATGAAAPPKPPKPPKAPKAPKPAPAPKAPKEAKPPKEKQADPAVSKKRDAAPAPAPPPAKKRKPTDAALSAWASTGDRVKALEAHLLDDSAKADWDKVGDWLKELGRMTIGIDDLTGSSIGRTVSSLKKVDNELVAKLAKHLVKKWKTLVKEEEASGGAK